MAGKNAQQNKNMMTNRTGQSGRAVYFNGKLLPFVSFCL